jgi:hypothetical protein
MNRFAGLVDEEFHSIELLQKIVWKFDIGFVDFIDQQNRPFIADEGIPELAAFDVIANILDAGVAQLAVAQARNSIGRSKAIAALTAIFKSSVAT